MEEKDIIDKIYMTTKCRSFRKGFSSAFFFILLPFFFFCTQQVNAQVFDSIQASLSTKPHLIGGFATKSTFIGGFSSPIFTAKAGIDFDNRIRMGVGLSWLKLPDYRSDRDNTPFFISKSFTDYSGFHTVHPALQFRYLNFFLDYVYYKNGKWQFSIPIQFGVGDSRYKYNFNGVNVIESRHTIFLYEPAVSGQYKILKWFGVGLDVGYRVMVVSNKNIGTKFNSPMYDIKALIFWGELYNLAFRKKASS
jgi:hypothetical protein